MEWGYFFNTMASGKIHFLIGAIVTAISIAIFYRYFNLQWAEFPIIILIIFFYSLLPDIDNRSSTITWVLLGLGITTVWAGYFFEHPLPYMENLLSVNTLLFGLVELTFILTIAMLFPHRGPTHTMWFVVLSPFALYFIPGFTYAQMPLLIACMIASYSHLLADGYIFKLTFKPKKGRW